MKLRHVLLSFIVLLLIVSSLWYFRPWSDHSPSKIAAFQNPANAAENFRNMEATFPSRPISKGAETRLFEEQLDRLELTYFHAGQEKSLEQFLSESSTTGLLVIKNGVIRHEQYRLGSDQESLFTSWSVAKSFVATAIAMALQEGRINSLDDPAEKYAPQYAGSDFGSSSLRSLLTMSTGVDFNEDYVSDDSDIRPFFFNTFILGKNPDDLLLPFKRSRNAFTDFHYISPNTQVLSAVLRGIYKQPLANVMSEKIWQPLAMESNASWLQHRAGKQGQALGYCCLNARLRDYGRFGQFYLDTAHGKGIGTQLLPPWWVDSLSKPASTIHQADGERYAGRGYNYHFWIPPKAISSQQQIFSASGVYGQYIWIDPSRNTVIVKTSADHDFLTRYEESMTVLTAILAYYD